MKCIKHIVICVLFIIITVITVSESQDASPCPRIFIYEPKGKEPDRWYGIITVLKDTDLKGVWLRIVFDRPIKQLGNWFGQVEKRSENQTDFLIKNPNFRLKAYTPKIVRIYVVYDVNQPPPRLIEFRVNAEVACPEDLTTTTPSTTTEQLFTSMAEDKPNNDVQDVSSQIINAGATTHKPDYEEVQQHLTPGAETLSNTANHQNLSDVCGTVATNYRFDRHIGQVAHKGEYPWHAMIFFTKGITVNYLCGASLISKYYLLTVAHCVIKIGTMVPVDPDYLVVYLGRYYVKQLDHRGSQLNYVEDIKPHSLYNPDTYDNDIALLKLFSPVNFTNYVRPICLWRESDNLLSLANRPGTVIGWGFDEKGKIEEKLMFVHMLVQNNEACSRSVGYYWKRFTTNNVFCANFIDDSVECVGDSGGAIVFPSINGNKGNSVWQLRGLLTVSVVLQNHLKCSKDRYVIFTDITKYRQWIEEHVNM